MGVTLYEYRLALKEIEALTAERNRLRSLVDARTAERDAALKDAQDAWQSELEQRTLAMALTAERDHAGRLLATTVAERDAAHAQVKAITDERDANWRSFQKWVARAETAEAERDRLVILVRNAVIDGPSVHPGHWINEAEEVLAALSGEPTSDD